jgi:hypothetical protein
VGEYRKPVGPSPQEFHLTGLFENQTVDSATVGAFMAATGAYVSQNVALDLRIAYASEGEVGFGAATCSY